MRAFEALGSFMTYKIFEAKELLILFAAQLVLGLLSLFVRPLLEKGGIIFHSTNAIYNIVGTLLTIAIALSAVLFVASKTSVTTEPAESSDNNLTSD
jgi:flagellin-like protein